MRYEITCGNSYSTLWHVTAWSDSSTKLAGDLNYDLEIASLNETEPVTLYLSQLAERWNHNCGADSNTSRKSNFAGKGSP